MGILRLLTINILTECVDAFFERKIEASEKIEKGEDLIEQFERIMDQILFIER